MPVWYQLEPARVLDELDSRPDGLSGAQAQERLARHGPNRIGGRQRVSIPRVLLHQFTSPLIYVLLGALVALAGIAWLTGQWRWADAVVIGLVLAINATVGFLQEYRAEHSVEALMKMIAPRATVLRDGQRSGIPAAQLVPGDVVEITEGQVVPADLRLLDSSSLQVNEAALTGESVPVEKDEAPLEDADDDLPAADQANMAFMGTAVTSGHARAVVVATGRGTRIGEIATQVQEAVRTRTPLEQRMQRLARWTTGVILGVAAVAFAVGLWMGRDWVEMLVLAIALAVAAIPEGLPIIVTVALAIGVNRMARQNAVIRRLPAVDTLGSCTTIVSDKTGTLTQNRMAVRVAYAGGQRHDWTDVQDTPDAARRVAEAAALHETLRIGVLCNNATLSGDGQDQPSGDPMEVALLQAGRDAGMERAALEQAFPRVDELPFHTRRRYMATLHAGSGGEDEEPLVLVKGAPEAVLALCDRALDADGRDSALDADDVRQQAEALADQGLRVLAMARGRGPAAFEAMKADSPGQALSFAGLQGLQDPPRPSAVEAVDRCHEAGIRVIMVTGDHARTAAAIARQVHLDRALAGALQAPSVEACTGREVSRMSDAELDQALARGNVFARIEPAQKTRLVERLKAARQIVAVTGDGVNDAPALKAAHIGAAMGSGTDVAKEASDMVVTDDNFASVYAAVEHGRTAFRNIRMATFFLFSTGVSIVLVILAALGLGWPLPFLPAQILWCNVVTNGVADVALAFEPGDRALHAAPPRPVDTGILDRLLVERLVVVGWWLAAGTLGMFLWTWEFDLATGTGSPDRLTQARTAALTTMVLFQMVHVFNCRSEYLSVFSKSLLTNRVLFVGVLASLAVHVAALYLPWTQELLGFEPLDLGTWALAAGVAATAIVVNEAHKRLRRETARARRRAAVRD